MTEQIKLRDVTLSAREKQIAALILRECAGEIEDWADALDRLPPGAVTKWLQEADRLEQEIR